MAKYVNKAYLNAEHKLRNSLEVEKGEAYLRTTFDDKSNGFGEPTSFEFEGYGAEMVPILADGLKFLSERNRTDTSSEKVGTKDTVEQFLKYYNLIYQSDLKIEDVIDKKA